MVFPPPPKPFGSDPPLARALLIPNVDFLNHTVKKFFAQSSFTGTCAFAFLAPIILMYDELSMPDGCTWNLKNNWPDRDALAFLTAKRSYEQFETLKADLNNCDCALAGDPEAKSRHETARSKYNDWINLHDFAYAHSDAMTPFHCLFSHLFYGLYACLKPKSATRTASRQARRWPQSPSDLLPHGADATIQSLEQWLEHIRFPDASPALLLVEIVRASRSLIVPAMLRSSKLPSLITAIMGEICQDARSSLAAPWFKTMPGATRAVALDFDRRISHIVPFMQLFSSARQTQLSKTDYLHFWKDEDKEMFFHASDIIRVYTETSLFTMPFEADPRAGKSREQTIATFREVTAGMILDLVAKYGMSRDALEAGARGLSDSWEADAKNLRVMLYEALFKLKIDRRCGYLGCTETLQTTKLKKCTGCKVMFWCSQAHQKLGWTHDELPHREVCSSMGRLVKKVEGNFRVNTQRALELAKGQTVADVMEIAKVLKWIQRFNTARSAGPIIVGAELLFHILRAHKKDGCCSSIACRRALPKPNWCSKCKIFKYCNRDCIAAGWTDTLAPHKDVCKRIKNLVECAGGNLEHVDVQSARFAERIISLEEDLITIRDWFGRFNAEYKM
uniref:MYND-type domain-containing protein n=1 Tax=Mycena chlorophos TaxID=658473 RepID=A0ABQ0LLM0_MYCCL|nr:predicted protein [Mycena chlorophos]